MSLILLPLLPLIGALLLAPVRLSSRPVWITATLLPPVLGLALVLPRIPAILAGEVQRATLSWLPRAGLELGVRIDGLALLFTLLILGIGLLIIVYAYHYLERPQGDARDPLPRFYILLLLFMGAMLGVVTAGNLLILVVYWELTSLSSFLLIGFWAHRRESRRGARMALVLTGGGGIALLAGAVLIGQAVGSYQLDAVLASGDVLRAHPLYPVMLVLVLLGAFTKSAQVPLHFWLPHAMAAPTPVSAYLHSATMVKAGVFLLARLHPALAGTELFALLLTTAGAATLLLGAWVALSRTDIKALLAYSTVSHLGLMVLLLGMGTPAAAAVALFHLVNHALFKAPLFMAAGIVDHATGTRDLDRLGGLWRVMPVTFVLSGITAAAMAGLPLLNGYLSKKQFLVASLDAPVAAGAVWLLPLVATVAGALSVAYALRLIHGVFLAVPPRPLPQAPHEAPAGMLWPLAIPAALCIVVGLAPVAVLGVLLDAAILATLGTDAPDLAALTAPPGPIATLLSVLALALGAAIFLLHRRFPDRVFGTSMGDGRRLFEALVGTVISGSQRLIAAIENGSLQRYVALLVAAAVIAGSSAFTGAAPWLGAVAPTSVDPVTAAGLMLLAVTAVAVAGFHHRRLLALLLIGASGLLVTLTFARFSAPDLALTQLSVEVMAVVILMLALSFLPQRSPRESSGRRRSRDVALAVTAGGGVGALCLAVLTRPHASISDWFVANSVPLGGGTNVVNVILVDFRGFDTLGEITVLGIAAVAIFVMTRTLRLTEREASKGRRQMTELGAHPMFLQVVSRPMLPILLLVAAYVFLRGHNLPGGGFIAGLIAAVALTLQYMANGLDWTHDRRYTPFRPVIAAGVLVAGFTGAGSILLGYPFLTAWFTHLNLPVVGEVELATAMIFDAGVFMTVVGATLLILSNLGKLMTIHGPGRAFG